MVDYTSARISKTAHPSIWRDDSQTGGRMARCYHGRRRWLPLSATHAHNMPWLASVTCICQTDFRDHEVGDEHCLERYWAGPGPVC